MLSRYRIWKIVSVTIILALSTIWVFASGKDAEDSQSDAENIAALDRQYQSAVERNDAHTMDKILADDFVLTRGDGSTFSKADLVNDARSKGVIYEHQIEIDNSQRVRVWGDTAVVTAKLWIKAKKGDTPIERKLWFSDTYVRTANGWRYVFGQASLPLPADK